MAERDLVRVAARNNAEWCDAFCRTHGIAGRFDDDAWWSAVRTPPLYPDAVTLVPGVDGRKLLARVDAAPGCSIKDSFGDLELTQLGFDVLFRAEWLCLERGRGSAPGWFVVESPDALTRWETAWGESPEDCPFFRPALLADASIAILARANRGRIVAGAVANRSATAIGLSNLFAADSDLEQAYVDAASAAQARWGPMPVLGYESGDALDAARAAGFMPVGDLAVWIAGG
jgi:hypothetical protein